MRKLVLMLAAAALIAGCQDETAPGDVTPPAAPRGLYSVTGDQKVTLYWLANTESDVAEYRVYQADCAGGNSCPYTRVGSTVMTSFVVPGLTNGVTHYFAVSAVDRSGNESELSKNDVFDTPRPAGYNQPLAERVASPSTSGYDFSAAVVRPWDDGSTDMYYQQTSGVAQMICPFTDTDIQDAGYATTLDAVDWAPSQGWSATGIVELIQGHCYVVRIGSTSVNYAKFRVNALSATQIVFDWAYQTAPNNPELRARPSTLETPRTRRFAAALTSPLHARLAAVSLAR